MGRSTTLSDSEEGASFDFIVIGGGTNGLTAASYLSKQGQRVLLVERQNYLGGGAITQDLTLQGFHHDVFATSINSWRTGPVQQDLELEKYGYHDVDPDPVAATPFKSGKTLAIYRDLNKTSNHLVSNAFLQRGFIGTTHSSTLAQCTTISRT